MSGFAFSMNQLFGWSHIIWVVLLILTSTLHYIRFLLRFPVDEERNMKSVVDYFREVYGFAIQYSHLPCLQVGNQKKVNYMPMEVNLSRILVSLSVNYFLNFNSWLMLLFRCTLSRLARLLRDKGAQRD